MSDEHTIEFHPSAIEEARGAREYYAARSERAGIAFLHELDRAIVAIAEAPRRWRAHEHGTRRFVMRRFPFLVIYHELGDQIVVVAVAHAHRRPGYWEGRVE